MSEGNDNVMALWSPEAEKGLLSGLFHGDYAADARAALPEDDAFFSEQHRRIWQQMHALQMAGQPIDPVLLCDRLRDLGLLEKVGGEGGIMELYTYRPIAAMVPEYLRIVRGKWLGREAIKAHTESIQRLHRGMAEEEGETDMQSLILDGEAKIYAVVEAASAGQVDAPVHASVVTAEVVERVTQLQENKGKILGVSTGWPDLDRAIGGQGLEGGDCFVIGARPKMGKTVVLCTLAKNISVTNRVPGLILSLEMSRERLWRRIMFGGYDIETSKASTGFLDRRGDQENLQRSIRELQAAPLWIHDAAMNTNDLRSVVRSYVRKHGIRIVYLDYAQLVDACTKLGKGEERLKIDEVMKVIHQLKKELSVIFIVLAQAGRGAEENPRHEPGPKDFDGGSAIEKYLDYGGFIHRPSKYKRWDQLDDKAQEAFRRQVEPARRANPDAWSPEVPIRNGVGQIVRKIDGSASMEWDIATDWDEHAILILCLNRNGDDARIWLRFQKKLTRFDPRTTKMWSNNEAQRQVGYEDKFTAPVPPPTKPTRPSVLGPARPPMPGEYLAAPKEDDGDMWDRDQDQ